MRKNSLTETTFLRTLVSLAAVALLGVTYGSTSTRGVAAAPEELCECAPNPATVATAACGCTVMFSNLVSSGAKCTEPPECEVVTEASCSASAQVTYSGGPGCSGTSNLATTAPCGGSGSSIRSCPGGGAASLTLQCASDCTEAE